MTVLSLRFDHLYVEYIGDLNIYIDVHSFVLVIISTYVCDPA